jgi:hypothetical protein
LPAEAIFAEINACHENLIDIATLAKSALRMRRSADKSGAILYKKRFAGNKLLQAVTFTKDNLKKTSQTLSFFR